ncbi:LmeA family phospholipid-binding protein [Nocardia sp. NPDC050406]|uniref:DUF2993 domain-containing protein n=1 Tax=Nocardia sp. NPDC050406 TaxID=3364318 RepID=UPI0037A92C20
MSSKPTSDDAAKRTDDAPHASDPDATLVGGAPADENGTAGTEVTHEPGLARQAGTSAPAAPDPTDDTVRAESGSATADPDATIKAAPGSDQPTEIIGQGVRVSDSTPTEIFAAPDHAENPAATGSGVDEHPTEVFAAGTPLSDAGPYAAYPVDEEHAGAAAAQGVSASGHDTKVMGAHGTEVFDAEGAAMAAGAAAPGGGQQPPVPPPPPGNEGAQGGSSWMRGSRRTLLIVGIVVALLAVAGLAGGEAYARRTVERCISSQFEQQMGSKIDVSFGAKPMLITMFDNKVGSVTVNSDDTKFGPAVGMVVHAKFNDIEVVDQGRGGGTIGSSSADVTWSNDGIAKTLGGLVSGVESNPADGTLTFAVLGGLAGLQVKPHVVGDKVEVTTESASLLGFGLPTDLVEGIVDVMAESLQSYPMGLKPTKVEVTNDGLHVTLAGGQAQLEPAQSDTAVTC